jgi:hypothetical protein
MKYIFVAGAPGSKWSSVVKNIYYSPSIDRSDYSDERTYHHDADGGVMHLMHLGAYFDPGMEFELPESMSTLTKKQAEELFDKPFSGTGVRIIKSHIFSYYENILYLKELWPECPIILVHRSNDSCLGWWVRCGHFNITYPKYDKYYVDLRTMSKIIDRQNEGILQAWNAKIGTLPSFDNTFTMKGGLITFNNIETAGFCRIQPPPEQYKQDYTIKDINVKVI